MLTQIKWKQAAELVFIVFQLSESIYQLAQAVEAWFTSFAFSASSSRQFIAFVTSLSSSFTLSSILELRKHKFQLKLHKKAFVCRAFACQQHEDCSLNFNSNFLFSFGFLFCVEKLLLRSYESINKFPRDKARREGSTFRRVEEMESQAQANKRKSLKMSGVANEDEDAIVTTTLKSKVVVVCCCLCKLEQFNHNHIICGLRFLIKWWIEVSSSSVFRLWTCKIKVESFATQKPFPFPPKLWMKLKLISICCLAAFRRKFIESQAQSQTHTEGESLHLLTLIMLRLIKHFTTN